MAYNATGGGWADKLGSVAGKVGDIVDKAKDAGFSVDDFAPQQQGQASNPLANLTNPAVVPPGIMSGIQNAVAAAPQVPAQGQELPGLVAAAKGMSDADVEKVLKLAQAQAMIAQAQQAQVGARRSTRTKPRHKRGSKTRRFKVSKKRTGRANRR